MTERIHQATTARDETGSRIGRRSLVTGAVHLGVVSLVLAGLPAVGWSRQSCGIARPRDLGYSLRFGGVRVAEMDIRVRCTGTFAFVEMEVVNRGVTAFFTGRNRTSMTALVGFDEDKVPQPSRFRASYQKPDRLRETELDFAPDGSLVHLLTRNQGRIQESPVPVELREPSIDPLATLLQLSAWLSNGPQEGEQLVFPVFEGRKRADLQIIYRDRRSVELNGQSREAHWLQAALQGISGFDEDDRFVTLPGEDLRWIDVFASDEVMPVPLLIYSTSTRISTRIELIRS